MCVLALAAILVPGMGPVSARANGFQIRPGDPDWSANAFAGMAAKAYDASTAWTNPAGMTQLDQNEVDLGAAGLLTSINFSGSNMLGPFATPGSDGGNAGGPALVPSLAAVWVVNQKLRLGFSVETPFGERTVYPTDFVGRYQALVSSISDVEIGLAAAYKITPTFSIGGGPIIDHFAARLTTAVNTGATAALTGDPEVDDAGDDWSLGYHLGVFWRPVADWRFGIDYRSRIRNAIEGNQTVSIPPLITALSPATAAELGGLATPMRTTITLPDIMTISAVWQIDPEWAALATLQWADWSVIQSLVLSGLNGSSSTLPLYFHNSWMGSLGVNYTPAALPKLMLQAGIGLDQSPVTDQDRTPRLPSLDEAILGFGLHYAITPAVMLKASFLHEFGIGPNSIDFSSGSTAGTLLGTYSTGVSVFGLGVGVKF